MMGIAMMSKFIFKVFGRTPDKKQDVYKLIQKTTTNVIDKMLTNKDKESHVVIRMNGVDENKMIDLMVNPQDGKLKMSVYTGTSRIAYKDFDEDMFRHHLRTMTRTSISGNATYSDKPSVLLLVPPNMMGNIMLSKKQSQICEVQPLPQI